MPGLLALYGRHRGKSCFMITEFYHRHVGGQRPPYVADLTDASAIRQTSGLPWLPLILPFDLPYQGMLAEAQALREGFVPHRTDGAHGWFSLCLHGISSVHTASHSHYGFTDQDAPYDWTDICKLCPITHEFFRDTFGYIAYARLRFMLLAPGGYVMPHSDATVDHLNAVNIALNNPAGCDFVMEDVGVVPFTDGQAMMLSLSRQHIVWNRSNEDRYHIIVHGLRDPAIWNPLIIESYAGL